MKIKKQGWINIHKMPNCRIVSGIFESKETAEYYTREFAEFAPLAITTATQIEWEEEE